MGRWRLVYEETPVFQQQPFTRRRSRKIPRVLIILAVIAGAGWVAKHVSNPWSGVQSTTGGAFNAAPTVEDTPSDYPPGGSDVVTRSAVESSAAARELSFMEIARGSVRMGDASPVFQWPDDAGSIAVSHVDSGRYVSVRGTTPNFLQIQLESGVIGYVPFSAASVMEMAQWKRCYTVQADSPMLRNPNAHSEKAGDTGDGTDALGEGQGLGNYPYIRTQNGNEGYVLGSQVLAQVECGE